MGALAIVVATAIAVAFWLMGRDRKSALQNVEGENERREDPSLQRNRVSLNEPKKSGEGPNEGPTLAVQPLESTREIEANAVRDRGNGGAQSPDESFVSIKGQTDLDNDVSLEALPEPQLPAPTDLPQIQAETVDSVGTKVLVGTELQPTSQDLKTTLQKEAERGGRRDLEKRGGRPRVAEPKAIGEQAPEIRQKVVRAEIVCWKSAREWFVGVELTGSTIARGEIHVFQNGPPLIEDEHETGCWPLKELCGQVVVRLEPADIRIALDDRFLLFRLSGRDLNEGCRVNRPSLGSYLVIAPRAWERDEELSGRAPATPERVFIDGYRAHFFTLDTDTAVIAFKDESGEIIKLKTRELQFELVGHRVNDFSENMGPLFGGSPPQIRAADRIMWADIETIVVGEEGNGRDRWRMSFMPKLGELDQALPGNVRGKKGGWYFLRFYDRTDDLIESMDFRFISGLREVEIIQSGPFPGPGGHKAATVKFRHEKGWKVISAGSKSRSLVVKNEARKTTITVPADPAFDHTYWNIVMPKFDDMRPDIVMPPSVKVELRILVERVWWSRRDANGGESVWFDEPILAKRRDFAATSTLTVEIHFPKARWTEEVYIGFDESTQHRYLVQVDETSVSIPLRDFGGAAAVANRNQAASLKLWIPAKGGEGISLFELRQRLTQVPAPANPLVNDPNPCHRRSCLTCDHAKVRRQIVRCRLKRWEDNGNRPEPLDKFVHENGHSGYICDPSRWYGEYHDSSGKYHST
jgi:hypothetical protein